MDPGGRQRPGELLQVAATIAAIAIALVTLRPASRATPFLLIGGLSAVAGTGYAMAAL